MKEINETVKKEFLNSLNAVRSAQGLAVIQDNEKRAVGNNGYSLNQKFELTGKIEPVAVQIGDNKTVYIGLELKDGGYLSLQRVMNLSSLNNYLLNGEVINEYFDDDNVEHKDAVKANVAEGVTASQLEKAMFKPVHRDLYDCAAWYVEHPEELPKTLYYAGTVVRQIVAKKDNTANFQKYRKGYKRAMSAPIFTETPIAAAVK